MFANMSIHINVHVCVRINTFSGKKREGKTQAIQTTTAAAAMMAV